MIVTSGWAQSSCRSFDYRQAQLRLHPSLAATINGIEQFTQRQLKMPSVAVTGEGATLSAVPAVITIPVVVHVIYNTAAENISDEQITSQIAVLNNDYQKRNADTTGIPLFYRSLAANCGFRFMLAGIDTDGQVTTGIIRKHTVIAAFSLNDNMKSSATGGDDPWNRDHYLNIWVCNLQDGILGYSSVVGGPRATDGVVVTYTAFGTTGAAQSPFNLGRTCTHEIGHWLNMIHIWGDADCGNDQVADTPPQSAATYGDPGGIVVSCNNAPYGNMYMNYMDFTDDAGMHMFTNGQRDRMRTLFASGGFRNSLLTSPAAVAPASKVSQVTQGSGLGLGPSVYPNPASGVVTINLNGSAVVGDLLEIYNQMGQLVKTIRVTQTTFQLDVSGLAGGIYFIRSENGMPASVQPLKLVKL
jgi:pregnancy-associated plasma protein-A/type IX secretion system substrate protein